jgi:hypothetical protein
MKQKKDILELSQKENIQKVKLEVPLINTKASPLIKIKTIQRRKDLRRKQNPLYRMDHPSPLVENLKSMPRDVASFINEEVVPYHDKVKL